MTVKYTGDGAYFQGVPARDLTEDEFAALPETQQTALLTSGLYERETQDTQELVVPAPVRTKKGATAEPTEPPAGG